MIFFATAGIAATLSPSILGIGVPQAATAYFTLFDVGANAAIPPLQPNGSTFNIAALAKGTVSILRLDTLPAFIGITSADVFVSAAQGATPLKNGNPIPGKSPNWICTVTQPGIVHSGSALRVLHLENGGVVVINRNCLATGLFVTLLAAVGPATADDGGPAAPVVAPAAAAPAGLLPSLLNSAEVQAKQKSSFAFDYGIPTSPALTLIGTSTAELAPSTSLKPYVFNVPASWGLVQDLQAFSLDFSFMWALQTLHLAPLETNDDYLKEGIPGHILYRTRLEGALFLGSDEKGNPAQQKSSRVAFVISTSLLKF